MDNYKVYASEQFVEEKLKNINVPEQVQADQNQNDETAPDYVKNRTHYEEVGIVNEPFVWEWDGNTDNVDILDINGMSCIKISDIVLTSDMQTEYIGRVNYDGYITEDISLKVNDAGNGVLVFSGQANSGGFFGAYSIPNDNTTIPNFATFPEKGLYVPLGTSLYYPCYFATTAPIERQGIIVHKIDPKFLPNVDSGLMRVIITQDDNDDWVADKTYEEISEAILNEKTPYVVIGDRVLYLQQSPIISEISTFERTPMHVFTSVDSNYYLYCVRILDNNAIDVADPIPLISEQYVNEQISAIKDGEILDSFKDVETALDSKASTATATTSANGLMSSTDKSKLDGIVIDTVLSTTSENAVQNKVVANALNGKVNTSDLNTLTVGNATKAGTASSLDATGVAQVKAIKVNDATSADTADKVTYSLKFGAKTYNGSSEQTITAGDLGLESAIRFIGITATAITDGGTQSPVIDGETHIPIRGDVVINSSTDQEFIWNGSAWEEMGNSSSHALKTITITAGDGLTGGGTLEANRTISLATSGATAGTYGAASSPSHGGTFAIPSFTVDTYGRVTKATTVNVTLPADSNTDTKVKQTSVASTTTTKYPVLMSYQNSPTSGQAYEARYNTGVTIGSGVLYGAAWNDYAEYREGTADFEPGRVICENGDDTLSLATERLQPGANIVSDTFGFAIGETEQAKTPIAVSGRVLVYPYEDRNSYAPGDAVCAAPNGTVSKMTREEIREYPERIIGTVSAIPSYETWGEGNVPVNGRIWVKIK